MKRTLTALLVFSALFVAACGDGTVAIPENDVKQAVATNLRNSSIGNASQWCDSLTSEAVKKFFGDKETCLREAEAELDGGEYIASASKVLYQGVSAKGEDKTRSATIASVVCSTPKGLFAQVSDLLFSVVEEESDGKLLFSVPPDEEEAYADAKNFAGAEGLAKIEAELDRKVAAADPRCADYLNK